MSLLPNSIRDFFDEAENLKSGKGERSEMLKVEFGESEGAHLSGVTMRQRKRPFRVLSPPSSSPEGVQGKSEGTEQLAMGGIFGGESNVRVGAADQGG